VPASGNLFFGGGTAARRSFIGSGLGETQVIQLPFEVTHRGQEEFSDELRSAASSTDPAFVRHTDAGDRVAVLARYTIVVGVALVLGIGIGIRVERRGQSDDSGGPVIPGRAVHYKSTRHRDKRGTIARPSDSDPHNEERHQADAEDDLTSMLRICGL
jgi:hypothetical protein